MFAAAALILTCCLAITGAQQNGDVRLSDRSSNGGRVEIFLDNEWGTIDASSGDVSGAAQTVCRQLGFDNVDSSGTVTELGYPPAGSSMPMKLESVFCGYNSSPGKANQHILRCNYDNPFSTTPDHDNDLAVQCIYDSSVIPYDTQVRLVQSGTGFASTGYVEIYIQGSWGPVCNMNDGDFDTACRQLGYTESSNSGSNGDYTNGLSDKLSSFYCYSYSYSCLRNCFNYPTSYYIPYCTDNSYVTCTFDTSDNYLYDGGNQSVCTLGNVVAVAVGVTIAVLVVFLLMITACVVVCCCLIPGCLIHSSRRKVVYQTI